MAETTILAPGTTGATSTAVPIAAGKTAIFAAYVASGAIPGGVEVALKLEVSGGVPVPIDLLRMDKPTSIHNPTETAISVIAVRPALSGGYSVGIKAIT